VWRDPHCFWKDIEEFEEDMDKSLELESLESSITKCLLGFADDVVV